MPIDALLFAQNASITNWMTPVWLISLGIAIGFVLVLVGIAKLYIGQKIGLLNRVAENSTLFATLGILTGLVLHGFVRRVVCVAKTGGRRWTSHST